MPDSMIAIPQGRGDKAHLRASEVSHLSWDRGESYARLNITMREGKVFSIRDWNGDAYEAERKILAAMEALFNDG